jgi:hypothetical protein
MNRRLRPSTGRGIVKCVVKELLSIATLGLYKSKPGSMKIDHIRIGFRYREDPEDLSSLADSIGEVGLLHPAVVTLEGRLIAGQRRPEACRSLGWTEIPLIVVDLLQAARGEPNLSATNCLPFWLTAGNAAESAFLQTCAPGIVRARNGTTAPGLNFLSLSFRYPRHRVTLPVDHSVSDRWKAESTVCRPFRSGSWRVPRTP